MFWLARYLASVEPRFQIVAWGSDTPLDSTAKRRIGGAVCVVASLVFTALVVISLWPDLNRWQGTPMIWFLAMAFMLLGAWLLGPLGKASPRATGARGPWAASVLPRWVEIGLFALILALGVFLRLYLINQIPAGIYVDETNGGLDALYLLEGRPASPFATGWYGTPNGYIYYMALIFRLFGANWLSLKWVSLLPAILTIPAVYLLGRTMFGPVEGLVAMAIMAVSRWHLTMSRWGWNETATPLFQVLAMFFLLRGLRGRRGLDFALSGLLMGLSMYTYLSARLAVLTWVVFILYWLLSDPDGLGPSIRRSAIGILIMAAASLVASAPILTTYASDPFGFGNRVSEISVMRDVKDQGTLRPVLLNLTDMLRFFHQTGDLQGKQNLPGEPMLDPVTGLFFAVGIAYALLEAPRLPPRDAPLVARHRTRWQLSQLPSRVAAVISHADRPAGGCLVGRRRAHDDLLRPYQAARSTRACPAVASLAPLAPCRLLGRGPVGRGGLGSLCVFSHSGTLDGRDSGFQSHREWRCARDPRGPRVRIGAFFSRRDLANSRL